MDGTHGSDVELISKTLQVEHKVFYFDLKENPRGHYLKISEKTSGSRSTIIVPASGISIFVDLFKYYASGDNPDPSGKEAPLESSEVQINTKVFYFDVGENQRGRFLKVSEVTRNRSTIIVPAGNADGDGWAAFRDVLAEIDEGRHSFAQDDNTLVDLQETSLPSVRTPVQSLGVLPGSSSLPGTSRSPRDEGSVVPSSNSDGSSSKIIRAEQKKFFFDLGSNARGQYLRISEVAGADRSAIILPASALELFYETIGHFVEMVRNQSVIETAPSRARPGAPPRSWSEG